jgi:ACS family hexuronate transporter-like MFS transporter
MVNSVFQLAYAGGLLGFGWFVDRVGTKVGYAVSIAAWSAAALGHALVFTFAGFLTARIALGLGEGGNFPAAIKATALWFPRKERAFATSIFNAGANVGAMVAPALVPPIAFALGWHWAFVFAGLAGLAWLFLWIPLYDVPGRVARLAPAELAYIQADREPEGGEGAGRPSWAALLSHRQTWSFIVAKFLTDPVWWFFLIWLPDYFKATRGLEIKRSWYLLVTIYAIITVLSIFGGWITGFLVGRGWSVTRARKTGMFVFACCVLPMLVVTQVGNWTAVLLLALAGSAHQAWSANLYTTVSDMFPKSAVASVIGLGGMAGALGGAAFPTLTGWLLDTAKRAGDVTAGYRLLFIFCALAYLVAFGIHQLLAPRLEPFPLAKV